MGGSSAGRDEWPGVETILSWLLGANELETEPTEGERAQRAGSSRRRSGRASGGRAGGSSSGWVCLSMGKGGAGGVGRAAGSTQDTSRDAIDGR